MRTRKLRGTKRQLQMIEKRLKETTSIFPNKFFDGLYAIKLPANQAFIEGLNQKGVASIRNYFLDCAMTLKHLKPNAAYKIVVLLFPENMWRSELIIFEHELAYQEFFTTHIHTGFWLEEKTSLQGLVHSHWIQKSFIESTEEEHNQTIICYIER